MNFVDVAIGATVCALYIASLVAAGMAGYCNGRERGFNEGWSERGIEDEEETAEWEGRAPFLPPPPKRKLLH